MGVVPAHFVVYAILHIHMWCVYVGHTVQAFASGLRKHMTDAAAMRDESRFPFMLRATRCCDWFIIPLEFCKAEFEACVCERSWWFQLRKFAVNDVPPAIPSPSPDAPLPKSSRSGRLVHMLQEIRCARVVKDWPVCNF